jgi:hypothetical protein
LPLLHADIGPLLTDASENWALIEREERSIWSVLGSFLFLFSRGFFALQNIKGVADGFGEILAAGLRRVGILERAHAPDNQAP